MHYDHSRIKKQYLIICEGVDTERFIISYLNNSSLESDPRFGNDIQTFDMGGISDLGRFLSTLKNLEGYESIKQLLILRDAETSVQSAIQSIKNALQANDLPVPDECNQWKSDDGCSIKIAFSLLPNCSKSPESGALEDLCWAILKDEDAEKQKADVQSFISNIIEKYDSIGSHEHKSRIHTFFSINKNYISLKIGEAAKAGAFDWNSEHLMPLKEVILNGF